VAVLAVIYVGSYRKLARPFGVAVQFEPHHHSRIRCRIRLERDAIAGNAVTDRGEQRMHAARVRCLRPRDFTCVLQFVPEGRGPDDGQRVAAQHNAHVSVRQGCRAKPRRPGRVGREQRLGFDMHDDVGGVERGDELAHQSRAGKTELERFGRPGIQRANVFNTLRRNGCGSSEQIHDEQIQRQLHESSGREANAAPSSTTCASRRLAPETSVSYCWNWWMLMRCDWMRCVRSDVEGG